MPPTSDVDLAAPRDPVPPAVGRLLVAGGLYQSLLALTNGNNDAAERLSGWPALAIGAAVIALVMAAVAGARSRRAGGVSVVAIAGVALALQAACVMAVGWFEFAFHRASDGSPPTSAALVALRFVAVPLLVLACVATFARPAIATRAAWIAVVLSLAMGAYVAARTQVGIDVLTFQRHASAALLAGTDPYAITFPNPYGPAQTAAFYSPDVVRDGRLLFGYPYLPATLFAVLPSYLLTGDVRFAHAVALSAAAACVVACAGRHRAGLAAAALVLAAPAGWRVVQIGWTEPFLMLTLGLAAVAATRGWRSLPVMVGLFFASKQYTVVYVPLLFLLLPRPLAMRSSLRFLGIAAVAAGAVTLPLALWDVRAFWHSAFAIQLAQPFRFDALSFLSLYAQAVGSPPPMASAIAFVAIVPVWALSIARAPRDAVGFVLGVAATTTVFLFFNRQAFLNYHTFAAYAVLLAAALLAARSRDEATTMSDPR